MLFFLTGQDIQVDDEMAYNCVMPSVYHFRFFSPVYMPEIIYSFIICLCVYRLVLLSVRPYVRPHVSNRLLGDVLHRSAGRSPLLNSLLLCTINLKCPYSFLFSTAAQLAADEKRTGRTMDASMQYKTASSVIVFDNMI